MLEEVRIKFNIILLYRKSTLVGESEHVLGVVMRTLSPTELAAINLLISELDLPPIEQDQRVQVASRLITEDRTIILFNSIQTCACQK